MSEALDITMGAPMGGSLLETKLYARPARSSLVARPRITKLLDGGLAASLILVSAPAGFGKTCALTEWLSTKDEAKPSGKADTHPLSFILHPFKAAWLSLDAADNDPERFWTYVILALQSIRDELGETALAQLRSPHPPALQQVIASLLNEIDAFEDCGVLILEDYHVITSTAIHSTLAYLLENLPPSFHIVISTRSDPPIPLARLRSRRQVVEIRTDDLRFTPDEATHFLNETMNLALSPKHVTALEERTEGWIAGLQMAALSMHGRDDIDGFIRAFAGTHRFIMDYLLEEVLARETEEVQSFLLQTAILQRLTGPLCDAVVGGENPRSQEMLERLEKRNLFIVPLDDERIWYRYHHLFADLLRTQLIKSLRAERVAELHVRASEWLASNGSAREAIHYASLASDDERVERFIEQSYMEMVNRGEQLEMRLWISKLSRELVYRRPWLCIYEAYSHSWFGELDEAELLIDKAEDCMRSMTHSPEAPLMQAQLAYVKSRVTAMRGDIPRAIQYCLIARENAPTNNLSLQFDSRVTLGYEYFLSGDYANASQVLAETIRLGSPAGAVTNTVAASCLLARLAAVRGQLNKSDEICQTAKQLITRSGSQHYDATGLVEMGIGDILCERNDLNGALAHTRQGLALLSFWGKADDLVLAHMTLGRIYLAQANTRDAIQTLAKTVELSRTSGLFSEARSAAEVAHARLWLVQGDLEAARRWVASSSEPSLPDDCFEREVIRIMRARVLITLDRPADALGLLSHLEEIARSEGRQGRLVEILILKALALYAAGDARKAEITLTKSLELAEPEGYVRIFLDEGEPLQTLLARWVTHAGASPQRAYAERLLSQFDSGRNANPVSVEEAFAPGTLIEPLTPREREVLRLVCNGDSNQVIADKLVITTSAVKKHTGNILGKLGVTSRAQAIVKAHELGLFPKAK